MPRRIGVVLLAGLMAFTLAWITRANAASLPLQAHGSPVIATGVQRCANGPLTAAPSGTPSGGQYTQVTVSGITGTCSVGGVAVILSTAPNTVVFSSTGAVSGGSFTATSSAFVPPASADGVVLVSLDGWMVPATWTYTPPTTTTTQPPTTTLPPSGSAISCQPVDPAVTATCTVNVSPQGWDFWGGGYRINNFTVTSTSTEPFQWEVRFDLSKQLTPPINQATGPLFPGYPVPAGSWWGQWTPANFTGENMCAASTNAELPIVRIRGRQGDNYNRWVSAGSPATGLGFGASQSGNSPLGTSIPAC